MVPRVVDSLFLVPRLCGGSGNGSLEISRPRSRSSILPEPRHNGGGGGRRGRFCVLVPFFFPLSFSLLFCFRREVKKRGRERERRRADKGVWVSIEAGSNNSSSGGGGDSRRWSKRSGARKRETTILLRTDIRYKLGRAITAFAMLLPRFLPSFLPLPLRFYPWYSIKVAKQPGRILDERERERRERERERLRRLEGPSRLE